MLERLLRWVPISFLFARLTDGRTICDEVTPGQILISPRVLTKVENAVRVEPVPSSSIEAAPTFLRPITAVRRRRSSTPRHRLGPISFRGGPNRRVVGPRRRLAGALSGAVLVVAVRALNPDHQP